MATLRSRGEEKKSLLKPHLCQCQLIYELSLYRNGAEGVLPIIHHPSTIIHQPSSINRSSAALCQAKNKTFFLGCSMDLIKLNLCLPQQKKYKYFLCLRSLRFCILLGLALLSSFSLAARTQANLVLARSCVRCCVFSLLIASRN